MTHSWFILVAKKGENCPNCVQEGGVIWAMPKRRGVLGRLSFTTFLYYISLLSGYTIREETQWTITKIVGFPKPLFVFDSLPTGEGVQTRPGWPGWVCEMEWAMDSMNYDTLSQKTSGKCAKVWLTNRSLGNWSGLVWWSWSRYSVGRRCKDW